ncbi:MAG: hypothetical protein ACE5LG_00965 [Anaerolineae bacterium]
MDIQREASERATRSLTPEEWERDVLRALLDSPGTRQTYERLSLEVSYDAFLDLFVGIIGRGFREAGATGLKGPRVKRQPGKRDDFVNQRGFAEGEGE